MGARLNRPRPGRVDSVDTQSPDSYSHFGVNQSVGTSYEDVWPAGSTIPMPTTAQTFRIRAGGSANDDIAGVGAQKVELVYLDSNWEVQTQVLDTAGASASAATSATGWRVQSAKVVQTGTLGSNNNGAIIIENTTSTQEMLRINGGAGVSQSCRYTVPANKVVKVMAVHVSVSAPNSADVRMFKVANVDSVTGPNYTSYKHLEWSIEDFAGATCIPLKSWVEVPAKSDICFDARRVTGAGNSKVGVRYDFIEEDA
jgi:hypothetical protein